MLPFGYVAPKSLEEVLQVLSDKQRSLAILAGGSGLLPALRAGTTQPDVLVDLRHIEELKQIQISGGNIEIGALTTLGAIEHSSLIRMQAPILAEMARCFGNPLLRNAATVGGNLAVGAPAADAVVPLLALDAHLQLQASSDSPRFVALSEFYVGSYQSVRTSNELITHISFATPTSDASWFYYRLGRRSAGAVAVVSVAVLVELRNQRVENARIALGAVAATPIRAFLAEAHLKGETLTEATIGKCIEIIEAEIDPRDDIYASSAYRTAMVRVLIGRALQQFSGR